MLLRYICYLVVIVAIPLQGQSAKSAEYAAFPKYGEKQSKMLFQQLYQWQKILKPLRTESKIIEDCRAANVCTNQAAQRMANFLQEISFEPLRTKIDRLHDFVNRQPYREDLRQFGLRDLWQTPLSFAQQGGDCEDYAIAKYLLLTLLGFADEDMRIAVMTKDNGAQVHAVLLVHLDGAWLMLDNLKTGARSASDYRDWVPQYAVNAAQAWRYVPDAATAQASVRNNTLPVSPAVGESSGRTAPSK